MTEYLLTEVEISSDEEFQDTEKIDLATRSDVDFINHDDIDYDDDVDFYCQTNKNLLLDELSAAKHNARKLRIEFEGESKYVEEDEEEFAIPNSEHVQFPEERQLQTTMNGTIINYQTEKFMNFQK